MNVQNKAPGIIQLCGTKIFVVNNNQTHAFLQELMILPDHFISPTILLARLVERKWKGW